LRALGAVALAALGLAASGARQVPGEQATSRAAPAAAPSLATAAGAVVRGPVDASRIALLFTGHEFAEGASVILDELGRRGLAASFFFTGAFLDNPEFAPHVRRMVREGHYVGPHSDGHLLYCPWTGPKTTLVSRAEFDADLDRNLAKLDRFGVPRGSVTHFVPPYEWANEEIAAWSRERGLLLLNPTPGTRAAADYTEDQDPRFVSSGRIVDSILEKERGDPAGLNGFLLLMHVGAGPRRTDKLHLRLGEVLDALTARGYRFVRVDALLPAVSR
jgi:peptidoglycan/xylan/chitin deacetylase (PgdA/CDA1 family)